MSANPTVSVLVASSLPATSSSNMNINGRNTSHHSPLSSRKHQDHHQHHHRFTYSGGIPREVLVQDEDHPIQTRVGHGAVPMNNSKVKHPEEHRSNNSSRSSRPVKEVVLTKPHCQTPISPLPMHSPVVRGRDVGLRQQMNERKRQMNKLRRSRSLDPDDRIHDGKGTRRTSGTTRARVLPLPNGMPTEVTFEEGNDDDQDADVDRDLDNCSNVSPLPVEVRPSLGGLLSGVMGRHLRPQQDERYDKDQNHLTPLGLCSEEVTGAQQQQQSLKARCKSASDIDLKASAAAFLAQHKDDHDDDDDDDDECFQKKRRNKKEGPRMKQASASRQQHHTHNSRNDRDRLLHSKDEESQSTPPIQRRHSSDYGTNYNNRSGVRESSLSPIRGSGQQQQHPAMILLGTTNSSGKNTATTSPTGWHSRRASLGSPRELQRAIIPNKGMVQEEEEEPRNYPTISRRRSSGGATRPVQRRRSHEEKKLSKTKRLMKRLSDSQEALLQENKSKAEHTSSIAGVAAVTFENGKEQTKSRSHQEAPDDLLNRKGNKAHTYTPPNTEQEEQQLRKARSRSSGDTKSIDEIPTGDDGGRGRRRSWQRKTDPKNRPRHVSRSLETPRLLTALHHTSSTADGNTKSNHHSSSKEEGRSHPRGDGRSTSSRPKSVVHGSTVYSSAYYYSKHQTASTRDEFYRQSHPNQATMDGLHGAPSAGGISTMTPTTLGMTSHHSSSYKGGAATTTTTSMASSSRRSDGDNHHRSKSMEHGRKLHHYHPSDDQHHQQQPSTVSRRHSSSVSHISGRQDPSNDLKESIGRRSRSSERSRLHHQHESSYRPNAQPADYGKPMMEIEIQSQPYQHLSADPTRSRRNKHVRSSSYNDGLSLLLEGGDSQFQRDAYDNRSGSFSSFDHPLILIDDPSMDEIIMKNDELVAAEDRLNRATLFLSRLRR